MKEAMRMEETIGVIGGADGPTSIFVAGADPVAVIAAVIIVAAAVAVAFRHVKRKHKK